MIPGVAFLAILALCAVGGQGKSVKHTATSDTTEAHDTESLLQAKVSVDQSKASITSLVCPPGDRGPGGPCNCEGAPGYDSATWLGPWCYEGKCYAGVDGDSRCHGKPPKKFGGRLDDGTWCFGERRDTECSTQHAVSGGDDDDTKTISCASGNRGAGGTCSCAESPGYDSATWKGPWCYEGKAYAGVGGDPRCEGKPPKKFGGSLGDGTWCFGEQRDTECKCTPERPISGGDDDDDDDVVVNVNVKPKKISCPSGNRGAGGTCSCAESPGYDSATWKGPWCYEGKAFAGVGGDPRCEGKPPKKFGGSLGDGTWCFGEQRDTECKCIPEPKKISCPSGNRGAGGTCSCAESPGYDSATWKGPWCYEGKAFAGVGGDPRCEGKPPKKFGGSLGDGTWCFGEQRDTECKCTPERPIGGGDDDDDNDV